MSSELYVAMLVVGLIALANVFHELRKHFEGDMTPEDRAREDHEARLW